MGLLLFFDLVDYHDAQDVRIGYHCVMDHDRLQRCLDAFDAENANDPVNELVEGQPVPRELLYAQRMSARLMNYEAQPSEALQLAARAQHICRWKIERLSYPEGRSGYLKWRNDLKVMHAQLAGEIMTRHVYDPDMIARVGQLIEKKNLKSDLEVQVLEDVICLVFMEFYLESFAQTKERGKMLEILRKTWRKMSTRAHLAALSLPVSADMKGLIAEAVGGE